MRIISALLLCLALCLCGCVASGSGSRWWVPTTWPIFSGESDIARAERSEQQAEDAAHEVTAAERKAMHAAHLEFSKALISLEAFASDAIAVQQARRFLNNGLGLLNQFDPLSATQAADLRKLVADLSSTVPAVVAAAERRQLAAEAEIAFRSEDLTAKNALLDKAEAKARAANVQARVAAMENIELANTLRTWRWGACLLGLALAAMSILGFYVRLQLGGVGKALQVLKLPADVETAIDTNTSALGQWFMRTGRERAEELARKAAAKMGLQT